MTRVSEAEASAYLAEFDPPPTEYVKTRLRRFVATLAAVPDGEGRLLELGCDNHFTLLLQKFTRYNVQTQNLPAGGSGYSDISRFIHKLSGEKVKFQRDEFNLESDLFPYPENHFDVVVCMEIIEHLLHDPMAMLVEIRRVLKPGGALVLTTPNLISWHAILKAIRGISPLEFSCFMRTHNPPMLQHAKEYMPDEIACLLESAGFSVEKLCTPHGLFPHERFRPQDWLLLAIVTLWYPLSGRHPKLLRNRGAHIFALARKSGPVRDRYPRLIYSET
jgi:SAM-dependent methyltransferase